MPSIDHNEIRHRILEILYKFAEQNSQSLGLDRERMQKTLQISEKLIDFNMLYLEEKGLIKLFKVTGSLWHSAQITAFGMDVIENKEKFGEQFPFIRVTIQEIHARDIYGTVVQAVESQVSFAQQVTKVFQRARKITETKTDIKASLREKTKNHLNLLEEELKRKEPDAGKIQTLWKWLKRNANWAVPTLTEIVLEGIKRAFG